jgi:hypothetical protein
MEQEVEGGLGSRQRDGLLRNDALNGFDLRGEYALQFE